MDTHNLPLFDTAHMEGHLEHPITERTIGMVGGILAFIGVLFTVHIAQLQLMNGTTYASLARENTLEGDILVAPRGVIYDRHGRLLAWNSASERGAGATSSVETLRQYATTTGIAHVVGFIRLPQRDAQGNYYAETTEGVEGVEKSYNTELAGINGRQLVETDARMTTVSRGAIVSPVPGASITLSIDTELQSILYEKIKSLAESVSFQGGAGVLMDVTTGEVLALTSYPEFSSNAIAEGDDDMIASYAASPQAPYVNRVTTGLYTPGSIVKPYFASAALSEGIVRPDTTFISTGQLYIPNPYHPGQGSRFTDWRAHGAVNVRRALAVSSNVYFYYIGGGFGQQEGLGIERLDEYARRFGFAEKSGIDLPEEETGVIPNPAWKKAVFGEDEVWRLGDTYNTAIGQYGFQVTPIQALRAVAAIANDGKLLTPRLVPSLTPFSSRDVNIPSRYLSIVREGMRQGVLEGTAVGLNVPYVTVAAKTGTAELGAEKQFVNSWVTGFFPYEKPRYAFVILMERGPRANLYGATFAMRQVLDTLHQTGSPYLGNSNSTDLE